MADITCTIKNLRGFWRGSTPKYKFKFSTLLSKFDDVKIGFSQNDALMLTKNLVDCKKEDDYSISITLTTEETMTLFACVTSGLGSAGHCASLLHSGTLRFIISRSSRFPPEAQLSRKIFGKRSSSVSHKVYSPMICLISVMPWRSSASLARQ